MMMVECVNFEVIFIKYFIAVLKTNEVHILFNWTININIILLAKVKME